MTAIDLPNGTLIVQLNETPLLHVGANSLLSTSQSHEFGITAHGVANIHGGKIISMLTTDHYIERIWRILVTPNFLYNIYDDEKYYPVEPVNMHIQLLINIIQKNNLVITTKKGKGKLPLFCGNGERVIPIYASDNTWDPASRNDALQVIVIFPSDNEVYDDLYDYLHQINSAELHLN